MANRRRRKIICSVCRHPERHRIEMLRLGGSPVDPLAEKFGLGRDAIYRHMANHVDAETKASIIADVPLKDLAARAAEEGVSLLDYFAIVRSTVIEQLLSAAAIGDRSGTAALAGRATEVLKEIGKLTGEMLRTSPINITHNTAVFVSSPAFARLERMLIERLGPHPEALGAVLEGLRALEEEGEPPGEAGPLLSLTANGEARHAAA